MKRSVGALLMMVSVLFGIAMFINAVVVEYNYITNRNKGTQNVSQRKKFDTDNNGDNNIVAH